jgi:glycosyltransferase involved in cell wall biosynthesis
VDRLYYDKDVKLLFERLDVGYIGEVTEDEKGPFLNAAKALIFPICWEEPFGLVMIEAMACGCPVIAFKGGSVPEIIEDGVTGCIVETREDACESVQKLPQLDRQYI